MNREEALKIIVELYINSKIAEYARKLIIANPEGEYFKQMTKNIQIMNDLEKYVKENLK